MKTRRPLLTLCLAALAIAGLLAGRSMAGRQPFRHLDAAEISSVRVGLYPPDTELDLSRKEIEALVLLLRETVTYRRDDTFREYSGQAVIFTLTMRDGTQTTVRPAPPLFDRRQRWLPGEIRPLRGAEPVWERSAPPVKKQKRPPSAAFFAVCV